MRPSYRIVNTLLVLISFIGIGFALYLEHVKGLNPCPLCIFQRVGLLAMGFFALIALIHHPRQRWLRRFYSLLSTLAIGWSVAVAARQVWIQHLPPDQVPSCGPGLNYLMDALPFQSVVKEVLSGSGECAVIDWTFLGQSLAVWSLVFFTFLLILNLWQLLRRS
ncbi:disulfide bond formation protein B [Acinetobacter qingfengensis]|uniref:Disulfide bond formation protein B n=1 Tax=Acinetobacter qingfengensis TaxID=1262585 RepID=A0A1E7R4Z6_9GAMM|nr:disulfide bond formation protein B [Acinetobacter qingfengensis]KAA8732386.1 disulfide bond formation protein B [Acinetobacter qingfengensis]OEY94381.1 dihydrolipoamide acetyltransferase [Acinetobacter qingfengensis]